MFHKNFDRKLILENGTQFYGHGFGASNDRVLELVFNTSMVGYQEILSDPTYADQAVVMTYPLIGNYGMADDDYETQNLTIGGLVVREYNDIPSNFRSTKTLSQVMNEHQIPGIYGLDTRKLTRTIRDLGSCKVLITDAATPVEEGMALLQATQLPRDSVSRVSCKMPWSMAVENARYHVAVIDCGVARSLLQNLHQNKCRITVLPWSVSMEEIDALCPDGILLSDGPGDPNDAGPVIQLVRQLRGSYPILGIGLGHQIIALACGANTYKLKFGHRGGNHPVKNTETGKIEITVQNHSYAVATDSLEHAGLSVTHLSVLDGTVEGIACQKDRLLGLQYQPEASPGPDGNPRMFDCFIRLMEECRHA